MDGSRARDGVLQCEAIALDVLPVKLRATIICSNEHAHFRTSQSAWMEVQIDDRL